MLSESTRKKISLNHADVSGENNPMFGKKHSFETRAKIANQASKRKGVRNPRWKGGKYLHNGYYIVLTPNHPFADSSGYVREHRLVMEAKLGRFLTKSEIIHHKDGNKTNNDINNLEIVTRGKHNQIHERHVGRMRDEKGKFL